MWLIHSDNDKIAGRNREQRGSSHWSVTTPLRFTPEHQLKIMRGGYYLQKGNFIAAARNRQFVLPGESNMPFFFPLVCTLAPRHATSTPSAYLIKRAGVSCARSEMTDRKSRASLNELFKLVAEEADPTCKYKKERREETISRAHF